MKALYFRLYWLRETSSDLGTPIQTEDLPAPIRDRILELAGGDTGEFGVRLPYLDQREMRKQNSLLASLTYERVDRLIRAVVPPEAATRDMLATLALADPLWRSAPPERDPNYFLTWQRVSQALQHWLRDRVPSEYFRNLDALEDRKRAYPMIVYQACRIFPGHPRTEFTYDLSNYPWRRDALAHSWKMTGSGIQRVMAVLQKRLDEAGRDSVSCRYAPLLHHDVLQAVQRRPRDYAHLLARESEIINAVVALGTRRDADTIHRSGRIINQALRTMHAQDMRRLGPDLLQEARRALAPYPPDSVENGGGIRALQNAIARASRSPHGSVGGEKNRHYRYPHGGGQMSDSGVVAHVHAGASQPAGQVV